MNIKYEEISYNNGIENKYFFPGDLIPKGFTKGLIRKNKNKGD